MFASRTKIRRLAAHMLLVWLFALATGIVHACVVVPALPQADRALGAGMGAGVHAIAHIVDEGMHDSHGTPGCDQCPNDEPSPGGHASCTKFCADEASSVPTAKQVFDPWPNLGLAMIPTLGILFATAEPRSEFVSNPAPDLPARIPVPIAFLRLTL